MSRLDHFYLILWLAFAVAMLVLAVAGQVAYVVGTITGVAVFYAVICAATMVKGRK